MPLPPEKLSQQPAAQVGDETELHYVVQAGQTRRQTRTQLRAAILSAWPSFIGTFLAAPNTAAARSAIGVLDVGHDYIGGLTAVWNSANSISITGGSAYIPSSGTVLAASAAITKSSLALSGATWYHVYLYSNAGVADIEIVTAVPASPYLGEARTKTGDTSRRYLFSFVTGAANTIIRFKHTGTRVSYLADYLVAPLAVLSNGTATTSTAISFAGIVPVTATRVNMTVLNSSTTAGASVFFNDADMGAVSNTSGQLSIGFGLNGFADFSISSSQTINYIYVLAPGANGVYVRAVGYNFAR
jgi:hypothetical protein